MTKGKRQQGKMETIVCLDTPQYFDSKSIFNNQKSIKMNQSKFFLGGLLGGLTMYLLGGLIYGQFARSIIMANSIAGTSKTPVDIFYIILGQLFISFLLTYVFECWAKIRTFADGLLGGGIIGFLSVVGNMLIYYGGQMPSI
jgi:hypothetical protein